MIHTVKGFGIVNKAEIDVFVELSCFFHDPADVGNLISGSSAFSKTSLNIRKFMVHILLKPGVENFEHYFTSVWDECNCAVVWAFFGIAFLWDWNERVTIAYSDPLSSGILPDQVIKWWWQRATLYLLGFIYKNPHFHDSGFFMDPSVTELVVHPECILKPGQFFIVKAHRNQTFIEEKSQVLKTNFCPLRLLGRVIHHSLLPWQTGPFLLRKTWLTPWS